MKKLFVVADTHFKSYKDYPQWLQHKYTCEYITTWNSKVRKCDTVIHVGDVAWGEPGLKLLNKLNGNKILVLGNHDTLPIEVYKQYFTDIYQYYRINDIVFSHQPIIAYHSSLKEYRYHNPGGTRIDTWEHLKPDQRWNKINTTIGNNISMSNVVTNIHGHFHFYGRSRFRVNFTPHGKYGYETRSRQEEPHKITPWDLFTVNDIPVNLKTILKHIKKKKVIAKLRGEP